MWIPLLGISENLASRPASAKSPADQAPVALTITLVDTSTVRFSIKSTTLHPTTRPPFNLKSWTRAWLTTNAPYSAADCAFSSVSRASSVMYSGYRTAPLSGSRSGQVPSCV